MSRGELDEATHKFISSQVPHLVDLKKTVIQLAPDIISINFAPHSTIPSAAVCLYDTVDTLEQARYALYEAIAHRIWFLERTKPADEFAAAFFSRFYVDDIALRLYSAAEHLAEAILNMLEIKAAEIARHKRKRVSRQAIVGNYLRKEKSSHAVTIAIMEFADSLEWQKTIRYRDAWVHSQPPLVKGLGIGYKRGQRWQLNEDGKGYKLTIGSGDYSEYSIDDLLQFIQPALFRFSEGVRTVVEFYSKILDKPDEGTGNDAQRLKT